MKSTGLSYLLGRDHMDAFTLDFFTDAVICAMERWLLIRDCMPSGQFLEKIKGLLEKEAVSIYREMTRAEREKR